MSGPKIHELTVTENPGKRTRAAPDAVRTTMNRAYAADLIRRLSEKLADVEDNPEIEVILFGEMA